MSKSHQEERFLNHWREHAPDDFPEPEREHRFHPTRKWRFDFAWLAVKVAVEIHGGTFARGAHSRGAGQTKDFEKLNEAQRLGWTVLQFDEMLLRDGPEAIDTVVSAMMTKAGLE